MDLRKLRYFVTVAEERHFTRAAARLGIAQPPLTQQIKALERELGLELFDRSTRRVELTAPGKVFLAEARDILARVQRATALAQRLAGGLDGHLRVGFTESASFNPLVTDCLRAFRTAYPGVDLRLEENVSTKLAADLRAGALDAAFVRPPLQSNEGLVLRPLGTEQMVAALPADHPLAARASLTLRELAGERFISYPRAVKPGLADRVIAAFEAKGLSPDVVQEAPQLSSTVNLVAAGLGVSIVPEGMRQVRPSAVRYVAIEDLAVEALLVLAYSDRETGPAPLNFIALVEAAAG